MKENASNSRKNWVNPDDAPDFTEDTFQKGQWMHGDKPILVSQAGKLLRQKMGCNKLETPKVPTSLRLDAATLAHFKAAGAGWQTRINEALSKAIKAGLA